MYATRPDIKPSGCSQRDLVDLLYMLVASIKGLCTKLDVTGGLGTSSTGATGYLALCYTAIFKTIIYDSQGNVTGNNGNEAHSISPTGIDAISLIELIYQLVDSLETLTEKLDADDANTSDYEDLCYEAIILPYQFESGLSTTILGNDNTSGGFSGAAPYLCYKFGPVGMPDQKHLVDFLYDYVDAWETLCEKLDVDGATTPPTGEDYESLWFTATILMRVGNSEGNVLGNAQTRLG